MKRFFLVCSLLAVSCAPVFAQSATTNAEASADPKVAFRTTIIELRKAADQNVAMKAYAELSNMMHKSITINNEKLSKATAEDEKGRLTKIVEKQQAIYRDTKMMAREVMKNKSEIATQLESFLQMI